ncbi:hypothetical protein SAMN05192566_0432 [Methylophilus rhizosphaerae]|uniref:DUF2798 domain-containing protein n=1 Tax=Methylophilus rhizosphaerae TaxID=492660 RepID=A0A1G8ZNW1_9PROT|nr:DUF2798 domain-containing protein [Methylophilus rhizosphaerae]SDK16789.1 hypothetical protein SAMN05192566_0432 [Methylophilus rhizosphaerae]
MVDSTNKRLALKRRLVFAALMSMVTMSIVGLPILLMHHVPVAWLLGQWLGSIFIAWPIAFLSILIIAPWLLRVTAWLVKDHTDAYVLANAAKIFAQISGR